MKRRWLEMLIRRRVFVITSIVLQAAFIALFITGVRGFFYVNMALQILSLIVCIRIINKHEKPAFKLTWVFIIMLLPVFGGLFYLIFYVQSSPRKYRRVGREGRIVRVEASLFPGSCLNELRDDPCFVHARYLQDYAGFPIYRNTRATFFPSGESFFQALMAEIAKAERYIFMEFFIVRDGKLLRKMLETLAQKAEAGVDVRMVYDDIGSFLAAPPDFPEVLSQLKIKCKVFNPARPILTTIQNNRDHRKIVSIDGKVAFTGGVNIGDEYINAQEKYGHWRDSGIMLEGEGAWGLTTIFADMWRVQNELNRLPVVWEYRDLYPWKNEKWETEDDLGYVQPYADSPLDSDNVGEHVYLQMINSAREYLYINTPYLIVDDNMLSALTLAAKSGVDIRIITPHHPDKKPVHMVTRSFYRRLIEAGVRVYEYSAGFNHSKAVVSDDTVATVGTTNFDFRSLYLHFECGVWLYKSPAIVHIKEDFLASLNQCEEITRAQCKGNFVVRATQDVLRVFAPLM